MTGSQLVALRQRLNLTQTAFWKAVKVTQSGGSRYEDGREMPKPVEELVRIVYLEGIPLHKVVAENFRDTSATDF